MENSNELIIGAADQKLVVHLGRMSNRHGLITGATGTGKTVTLQVLAEGCAKMGVPVFAVDIKGDLSGLALAGKPNLKIEERLKVIPLPAYNQRMYPVLFWDIFGKQGHPLRSTVSEMGPLLLSNLLELNDTQTGVLYAAFKVADDEGLLILDLKDLRAVLNWLGDNASELGSKYGNITSSSIGAIQRRLLVLEEQEGEKYFGEPAIRLQDLMKRDFSGQGVISILDATVLHSQSPKVYGTFLFWLLSELYEQLPEVGDLPKPEMVLFFDEAHLLFDQAPKVLLDKIEQVLRLIRSKGVGIYFITQNATDIPETVLGQLGLRIQHAIRAFTPKDRKAIKLISETFASNPKVDIASALTEMGTGEALVSTLDIKGRPLPVERVLVAPPESNIGPLGPDERALHLQRSPLAGVYDTPLDRESAYELLRERALLEQRNLQEEVQRKNGEERPKVPASRRQGIGEAMAKSVARSIGSQIGRQIIRGILGSIFGGRR